MTPNYDKNDYFSELITDPESKDSSKLFPQYDYMCLILTINVWHVGWRDAIAGP